MNSTFQVSNVPLDGCFKDTRDHKPNNIHSNNICSEADSLRCSVKKAFLKFREIHRKTPALESLLKKSCRLRPTTLFKKRGSGTGVFLEFGEILMNSFFTEHLRWLLLYVCQYRMIRTSNLFCFAMYNHIKKYLKYVNKHVLISKVVLP